MFNLYPVGFDEFIRELAVCSQSHGGIVVFEGASLGFQCDRPIEHVDFLVSVSVVNEFRVIIIVFPRLHERFIR